nr:hypothetical protein [Geodermatophilaceae bacterium]
GVPGVERARRRADAASATLALHGPAAAAAELEQVLDAPGTVGNAAAFGAADDTASRLLLEARLAAFSLYTAEEAERSGRRLRQSRNCPGTPATSAPFSQPWPTGFSTPAGTLAAWPT